MYKSPRVAMPEEFDTSLKYIVQDIVTNVGGTQASIKFRNDAYDVDPALASTAMPGFTEFAAFYARYRVLTMKYKFSAANQEAFSLTVIHGFSNTSIASGSLAITYGGNPLMHTASLGPATGQGIKVFSQKASIPKISGTGQSLYDDLFAGLTTSATVNLQCFANFGIIAPVALTALGCLVTVEVQLGLRFYRPLFMVS